MAVSAASVLKFAHGGDELPAIRCGVQSQFEYPEGAPVPDLAVRKKRPCTVVALAARADDELSDAVLLIDDAGGRQGSGTLVGMVLSVNDGAHLRHVDRIHKRLRIV